MRICPITPQYLHTFLLEPFLEGVERVNQAWRGVNFHSLRPSLLNLRERSLAFLTGTALLLPFLNLIIWTFWQILGSPEKLSDPYSLEVDLPLPSKSAPTAPTSVPKHVRQRSIQTYVFREWASIGEVDVESTLEQRGQLTFFKQNSPAYRSDSIYGANGEISRFHHESNGKIFSASLKGRTLEASIQEREGEAQKKSFILDEKWPWIQQPTIGFKNFMGSEQETIHFYCLLPENPVSSWLSPPPLLLKAVATKKGIEELPGMGKLIKVEVQPIERPYSYAQPGVLWFEPETLILKKFLEPGMPGTTQKGGELVPPHQLPESAHP